MFPVVCCKGWTWTETWKTWPTFSSLNAVPANITKKSYYGDEICLVFSS